MQIIRLALIGFFGVGIVVEALLIYLSFIYFPNGGIVFAQVLHVIALAFFCYMFIITIRAYKRQKARNAKRQESKMAACQNGSAEKGDGMNYITTPSAAWAFDQPRAHSTAAAVSRRAHSAPSAVCKSRLAGLSPTPQGAAEPASANSYGKPSTLTTIANPNCANSITARRQPGQPGQQDELQTYRA